MVGHGSASSSLGGSYFLVFLENQELVALPLVPLANRVWTLFLASLLAIPLCPAIRPEPHLKYRKKKQPQLFGTE
jgi:hypothetical protein